MLKKNLFFNSLLSISQFIFPLITFPYVSRILGPAGLGSISFIDSFTQYFMLFSALGIPLYGVREIAKVKEDKAELKKLFSEITVIHLLSTLTFSVIFVITGLIIPDLRNHFDLILLGIVMMFCSVFAVEWLFQGLGNFSFLAIRTLIIRSLSIILLFVFLKPNSTALVFYSISASVFFLTGVTNQYYVRKEVKIQLSGLELKKHLRPLIIILGSSLAVSVYILMDNIILGFIKDDTAVGLYSTAIRIVRIPFAIFGTISGVMIPQISHAYGTKDYEQINSLVNKSFAFVCVAAIPISMGICVSASFLVNTFAGGQFNGAILALQILSPVIVLVGLNNLFGMQLLIPMGKDKLLFRSVFVGMIASLILNICLIPFFSHLGTSITNLATETLVTLLTFVFAKRYISIKVDLRLLLKCLVAATAFVPISYGIRLLKLNNILEEFMVISSCVIFYFLFVWFYLKNEYVENVKGLLLSKLPFSFT